MNYDVDLKYRNNSNLNSTHLSSIKIFLMLVHTLAKIHFRNLNYQSYEIKYILDFVTLLELKYVYFPWFFKSVTFESHWITKQYTHHSVFAFLMIYWHKAHLLAPWNENQLVSWFRYISSAQLRKVLLLSLIDVYFSKKRDLFTFFQNIQNLILTNLHYFFLSGLGRCDFCISTTCGRNICKKSFFQEILMYR